MQKTAIFSGIATALITPMKDGAIDYSALDDIIDVQIASGIGAIVIAGTTGEASTLSESERYALYEFAKAHTGGAVPLIFGTGSNDTARAVKASEKAAKLGADGELAETLGGVALALIPSVIYVITEGKIDAESARGLIKDASAELDELTK